MIKTFKSRLILLSMAFLVVFMMLTAIGLESAVVKRTLEGDKLGLQVYLYTLQRIEQI